jgi:hypothetical protein
VFVSENLVMTARPARLIAVVFCYVGVLVGCGESDGFHSERLGQPIAQRLEMRCDEEQTRCSAVLPSSPNDAAQPQTLLLRLQAPDLPALAPLTFELEADGEGGFDQRVLIRAWIEGRDMFMGEHLLQPDYDPARQIFVLKGMIPVCVTGSEMVWRLSVELELNNTKVLAYADLRSLKHS